MIDVMLRIVADGFVVIIFLIAAYSFIVKIPKQMWKYWAIRIVLAGITSYLFAKLIAYFYQPETLRPFEKLGVDAGAAYLNNPGFPSDHALFAMFLTLAVWFSTRHKALSVILLSLTLLMGAARVLALVHTPTDVIGGCLIAIVGCVWYGHMPEKVVKLYKRGEKNE